MARSPHKKTLRQMSSIERAVYYAEKAKQWTDFILPGGPTATEESLEKVGKLTEETKAKRRAYFYLRDALDQLYAAKSLEPPA